MWETAEGACNRYQIRNAHPRHPFRKVVELRDPDLFGWRGNRLAVFVDQDNLTGLRIHLDPDRCLLQRALAEAPNTEGIQ